MGAWLSKVMHAILSDPHEGVRQPLYAAQEARAKVTLELVSRGQPSVMATTIEQIRDVDLVISQPMVGGHTYPLAFGDNVRLNFTVGDVAYSAATRSLGRIKITSGGTLATRNDAMIFAYRLALPRTLDSDDQRKHPRVQLELAQVEAHLYAPDSIGAPLVGRLADVSMSGARLVTAMPVMFMFPGQSLFLKSTMPDPVGLIDELVEVARIDTDPRSGETSIGIRFRKKIDGLAEMIRAQSGRV